MGAGLALAGFAADAPAQAAPEGASRVIVIGAGLAGLAAAQALSRRGARVLVLEARNRAGGRIQTSRLWPDAPADLGASWIHGVNGNPLTALAQAAGARTLATRSDSAQLFVAPGLAAQGVSDDGAHWAAALIARAQARAQEAQSDLSLRAAINRVIPSGGLSPVRAAQLAHHLAGAYEQEYAGSAEALSAWWTGEDAAFGGEDALFPGGYDRLIAHLADGLDIRLGAPVAHVRWEGPGVELELGSGERLAADRVIVTVPLGVLKAGGLRFTPDLPADKQAAITRLGMGDIAKLFLRFEAPFWPTDVDWLEYLKPDPGRWSQWVNLAGAGAPVLLGFAGADSARQVEALDERALIAEASTTLRDMFGSATPAPVAAQRTRWSADIHSGGAYSFYAVGSSPADRQALARPEADGALRFAGEACSTAYYGTAHGAFLSGQAAGLD